MPEPLKVLSLFSGCGGMDLGFEGGFRVHHGAVNPATHPDIFLGTDHTNYVTIRPTRFQTVFANDILEPARLAWNRYFSKRGDAADVYRVASIVDLVRAHHKGEKVFPEGVDLVTGGFPCQDFSLAGSRKGFHSGKDHHGHPIHPDIPSVETRGRLYMWLKEVVEISRPKVFVAENVKGLVNLSNVKEIIQHDFSTAGDNDYLVLPPRVLQAANYGVPQSRERVIFIGLKRSALKPAALEALAKDVIDPAYDPYPHPSHAYTVKGEKLREPLILRKLFQGLPEPEQSLDLSQQHYSRAKFMGKHCQGQTEVRLDGVGPTIRAEHHGNIEFRRLSAERGGLNQDETGPFYQERRLTPRECALIQSFPPDYDFVLPGKGQRYTLSPSAAYKLIGNAVPPLLAYHIALGLERVWSSYFAD